MQHNIDIKLKNVKNNVYIDYEKKIKIRFLNLYDFYRFNLTLKDISIIYPDIEIHENPMMMSRSLNNIKRINIAKLIKYKKEIDLQPDNIIGGLIVDEECIVDYLFLTNKKYRARLNNLNTIKQQLNQNNKIIFYNINVSNEQFFDDINKFAQLKNNIYILNIDDNLSYLVQEIGKQIIDKENIFFNFKPLHNNIETDYKGINIFYMFN